MDRFEAMNVFCKVVELGSFAAAAERLDISTSATSRLIAQLEATLNARLLNRTTRRISLTEDGRGYYERCLQLLSDLEEAEESVGSASVELRGTLRLTAPISFGAWHLAPAIADFARFHPQVKFDISLSDQQIDLVEEGLDLAIRVGALGSQNLVARPIGKARMMLCAAQNYLNAHGIPQTPDDLAKHQCLTYAYASENHVWRFADPEDKGGKREGKGPISVRIGGSTHSNNGLLLRELAAQGMGLTMAPDFILQVAVDEGRLVEVMKEWAPTPLTIYAAYPSRKHLSAKVRGFANFLQEWLETKCPSVGADLKG
ncbi:LysR family transcriptional regulator [Uliginosibacterium sp. H3]|uniref:LysR family transcriptional regulator n=1 Tax=Uliginosibacterium silvisoli TaxID=3114758 RepID=A0ABU6K583_9RHOO|nr:LysR family transcriptional regulator [Uliginosibacterium sp. H3]